jgi:hypothetical protein
MLAVRAQTTPFLENGKWGIKSDSGEVVIAARYDTIFDFDPSGRVCIACHKIKSAPSNKFIRVTSISLSCNYLNRQNQRLLIRNRAGDTCGVFSLSRNSLQQLYSDEEVFTVTTRSKKFLVKKDFTQLTFRGYKNVSLSNEPLFYITESENEAETVLTGVINTREELVVPHSYTSIRINTYDSLIVACTAGLGNALDDVYNYSGKRLESYNRHVDQATRNFIIHKFFEPEYYVIYNISTREETRLTADELLVAPDDALRIRIKDEWFLFDMKTNQKKPLKQT